MIKQNYGTELKKFLRKVSPKKTVISPADLIEFFDMYKIPYRGRGEKIKPYTIERADWTIKITKNRVVFEHWPRNIQGVTLSRDAQEAFCKFFAVRVDSPRQIGVTTRNKKAIVDFIT